jgi:hypothetical protein
MERGRVRRAAPPRPPRKRKREIDEEDRQQSVRLGFPVPREDASDLYSEADAATGPPRMPIVPFRQIRRHVLVGPDAAAGPTTDGAPPPVQGEHRDSKCYGCIHSFGQTKTGGENVQLTEISNWFESHVDLLEPNYLIRKVYQMYEERIYGPETDTGKVVMYWSEEQVYKHITTHMLNPEFMMKLSIQTNNVIQQQIQETLFSEDSKGNYVPTSAERFRQFATMVKLSTETQIAYAKLRRGG